MVWGASEIGAADPCRRSFGILVSAEAAVCAIWPLPSNDKRVTLRRPGARPAHFFLCLHGGLEGGVAACFPSPPPGSPATRADHPFSAMPKKPSALPDGQRASQKSAHGRTLLIGAALAASVLLLYARVGGHSFINYDDNQYVFENPRVSGGVSWQNILWAFQTGYAANWHPLTWISHLLDGELFGLNPSPQHVVSAVLHAANAALLFFALQSMTGLPWRSAIVAALFAWHPTHVESVAWIAERKDVLSGFFWMLTLLAYTRYARAPSPGRYGLVALCFALGLLSKPMLVTLPCVLLLLDYWPLHRLRSVAQLRPLLIEKIPLLALSAAASIVTFLVQRAGGAVVRLDDVPLLHRFGGALQSYFFYLGKTFWPRDLFVPYWYDFRPEWLPLAGAGLAFCAITFAVFRYGPRFRYLPVGWCWFLGTLVPVIGLVQVGSQSAADRYTYLPTIGIFLLVVWGAADLLRFWRLDRTIVATASLVMLGACGLLTFRQIGHWKNSVTLFSHTLNVDPPNLVAMNLLAWTYATDLDSRLRDPSKALHLASLTAEITKRRHAVSLRVLAAAHAEAGQFELAAATAREALALPEAKIQPYFTERLEAELAGYVEDSAIRER